MNNLKSLSLFFVAGTLLVSSCKKSNPEPVPVPIIETPSYTVPATYDFGANMNLTPGTQRLNMLKELVAYVRSTHDATAHVVIEETKMRNMFTNTGNPFADAALNSSGVNIREKTSNAFGAHAEYEALFAEAASVSQSTVEGRDGVAGKVLGPVPSNPSAVRAAYLFNANGFEYKELADKGAMGAFLYSAGTTILKNIATFDNSTLIDGKGTAQEQAWDEAFAYFGVPVSFPTSTVGLAFWGSYCNAVNGAIGSNSTMMNAFLKGRAAIRHKDNAARDAARDVLVANWEKVGAARLITYLKQSKTNFSNDGPRNHALSEAYGFIRAFRYNPSKTISDADISALLGFIGANLYSVSQSNIDQAITKVAAVFNLDASKL